MVGPKTWQRSLVGQVRRCAWEFLAHLSAFVVLRLHVSTSFQSTATATAVLDSPLLFVIQAVVFDLQTGLSKMLVSLTVGKVDAGVAVLLTQDNRLVGPRSATTGYPLFLHIRGDKEDPRPFLLPCASNTKKLFQR